MANIQLDGFYSLKNLNTHKVDGFDFYVAHVTINK